MTIRSDPSVRQPVELISLGGCSKMPGCKVPEILSREAYI